MEIKRYIQPIIYYRLKVGDTKNSVADKFNTTLNNVVSTNNSYEEGDFVCVYNANEKIHIVKPMETLKEISEKYSIDENVIIEKNNIKNKTLFIGQRLKM